MANRTQKITLLNDRGIMGDNNPRLPDPSKIDYGQLAINYSKSKELSKVKVRVNDNNTFQIQINGYPISKELSNEEFILNIPSSHSGLFHLRFSLYPLLFLLSDMDSQ